MTDERKAALFFELFSGLPRQGPGDDASTLRALGLVPGVSERTRVLDLGCGTGRQTLVLARHSGARVVAIDSHPPYVEELASRARELGMAGRIDARVGDMGRLELPPASFDLLWCEGAVYAVGFETALREWRRLLAPGGHLAVTEVCWTKPDPPRECLAFWEEEYPAIRDLASRLASIGDCGFETVGHFPLPRSAWWDDYYRPLEAKLAGFRERHRGDEDAREVADAVEREIRAFQAYSDFYGYEFFVMRARARRV